MKTLDEDVGYIHPPPSYPCIVGSKAIEQGISNNLTEKFVNMGGESQVEGEIGIVMSFEEFHVWGSMSRISSNDTDSSPS